MSSVFHELCATGRSPRLELLTSKEKEEIATWEKPTDIQPSRGPLLRYADSDKELKLAVNEYFEIVPVDSPGVFTQGTLDFGWPVSARDGTKVAFVADIKRTPWTAADGPRSLQLLTYCWMAVAHYNADAYCPGLWIAETGQWNWSDQVVLVDSEQARRDLRMVTAALKNDTGEACTGSHCATHCYARLHCPAWTAPPTDHEAIAPALEQRLDESNALAALNEVQRLEKLLELAQDNLKAYVKHGGVISNEDNSKRYAGIICQGRKSLNRELLKKSVPESVLKDCTTTGADFTQYRWINNKGKR